MEKGTTDEKIIEQVLKSISNRVVSLCLAILEEEIKTETHKIIIRYKLKREAKSFIEQEMAKYYFKSIVDKVDLGGLYEYFNKNLRKDFKEWFTEGDPINKIKKKNEIIKKAIIFARVKDENSKKGVKELTEKLADFIRTCYDEFINKDSLIAISDINEQTNKSEKRIIRIILNKFKVLIQKNNDIDRVLQHLKTMSYNDKKFGSRGIIKEDYDKYEELNELLNKAFIEKNSLKKHDLLEELIQLIDGMKDNQRIEVFTWIYDSFCQNNKNNPNDILWFATNTDYKPLIYAKALLDSIECTLDNSDCSLAEITMIHRLEESYNIVRCVAKDSSIVPDSNFAKSVERLFGQLERIADGQIEFEDELIPNETPSIQPDTMRKRLGDEGFFENVTTVYSEAFDSVRGADIMNRNHMESNLLKWISSGRVVVLQGPQIFDNKNMLNLITEKDEVRKLCEEGYIVFSPYRTFKNPVDMLISSLHNTHFKFSSHRKYNVSDGYMDDNITNYRNNVAKALYEGLNYRTFKEKYGYDNDEELYQLFEGYYYIRKIFNDNSAYFHQDRLKSKREKYLSSPKLEVSFKDAINDFLNSLMEDETDYTIYKRKDRIVACYSLMSEFEMQYYFGKPDAKWNRSDMDNWIDKQLENADEDEKENLLFFKTAIDEAYNIFLGYKSSDDVRIITESDMFRTHKNEKKPYLPQTGLRIDFSIRVFQSKVVNLNVRRLTWKDIIREASNYRDLEVKNNIKSISSSEYIREKQNQDTMGYSFIDGRHAEPTTYTFEDSNGEISNVSNERIGDEQPTELAQITEKE